MSEKDEGMDLRRSIQRWADLNPAAVAAGSQAQAQFCIEDARHDLLVLAAALGITARNS